MKSIRSIIRNLLKEEMYKPSTVSGKFAIWTNWLDDENFHQDEIDFVMYDWSHAQANIDEMIDFAGSSPNYELDGNNVLEAIEEQNENGYSSIAAVMRIKVPDRGFGNCNGAWEVVRSAAEGGYGPTLYDMVMSISPMGLTPDRLQVSDEAKKVWDFYAHKRPEIEKRFLDGQELTTTDFDDCRTHAPRSYLLYHLTRVMAVNFLKEYYPLAYKAYEKNQSMEDIMDSGNMKGDSFIDRFQTSVFRLPEEDKETIEDNMDELYDLWQDYKYDNELNLMDLKASQTHFKQDGNDEYLDLSYNTSYAKDHFYAMQSNHYDFLDYIREEAAVLGEYVGYDAVDQFEEDPSDVHFTVRRYFNERYG